MGDVGVLLRFCRPDLHAADDDLLSRASAIGAGKEHPSGGARASRLLLRRRLAHVPAAEVCPVGHAGAREQTAGLLVLLVLVLVLVV
jgi:hypothetical protein